MVKKFSLKIGQKSSNMDVLKFVPLLRPNRYARFCQNKNLSKQKLAKEKTWGWLDLNQRTPKRRDLQSLAIGRYATPPENEKDADSRN
jgi:hypothetical protein